MERHGASKRGRGPRDTLTGTDQRFPYDEGGKTRSTGF